MSRGASLSEEDKRSRAISSETFPCPINVICLADAKSNGGGFECERVLEAFEVLEGWPVYQCTIESAGIAAEPSDGKTNGKEAPYARIR